MTYEEKSAIVIEQLRADRDKLLNALNEIQTEINTPNKGTCDYFIVDRIEEIIKKYNEESEEEWTQDRKQKNIRRCMKIF